MSMVLTLFLWFNDYLNRFNIFGILNSSLIMMTVTIFGMYVPCEALVPVRYVSFDSDLIFLIFEQG